ncbi:MAG: nitroreductase family protein [Anaerolineales bacterium]
MSKLVMGPLPDPRDLSLDEMEERARSFAHEVSWRRSVRDFSTQPVPFSIIESCLKAAGRAPSGANQQLWHFAVIEDPAVKAGIRRAAEAEEKQFYEERATMDWLEALRPLGTNWRKPFLEDAPYLVAVFYQAYGFSADGERVKHYYAMESVGIAIGVLIAALHHAGLATLTHTPSPMGFLSDILHRPSNERPFLLLITRFAAEDARVPTIQKKPIEKFISRI